MDIQNALDKAIAQLVEDIKADYADWHKRSPGNDEVKRDMIKRFNDSISVQLGRKYIKIIKDGSVWGFIVAAENDKKFKVGDILKPAGWATPARNSARGNVLEGGYTVNWTGPLYLK